MDKIPEDIALLLQTEAERINSPQFIAADPVQFPRRFSEIRDIEISALIAAIMAWGNRTMICRDIERLLDSMDNQPAAFVMEEAYELIPDERNLHRTLFGRHLKYLLRGLNRIYNLYPSLDAFANAHSVGAAEAPAWKLAECLQKECCRVNGDTYCPQCLPTNLKTTALKRINMALRWLVRDDGIVDMGVWKSIPKSKLFIPLDVHVGNTSRSLGLLTRKSADRKAVELLTEKLKTLNPDDPAIFDFALFGIGIEQKNASAEKLIPPVAL